MTPTGAARLAGVTGDPISHSLSPVVMQYWIEAAGIDALYAPFPIKPEDFDSAVRGLAKTGCRGLNVTLPHKEAALEIAAATSSTARAVGAANLLTFTASGIHADNTDISGFLYALEPANLDYTKTQALVFGAGGAARALVYALLTVGVAQVSICNRNTTRAQGLAREIAPDAGIIPWDARDDALAGSNLIVNATSLGLNGTEDLVLDWQRVAPGSVVFDSVYTPLNTGFLAGARQRGLTAIDGLDMLIGQARPSFQAFYGRPAPHIPDLRDRLVRRLEAK
ncbi:shikimate dehydrogenase [Maricaulis maris]|uniref:Shikimate dehydrogenase (NADP(+)) n=1 Tax=Maricaulis maris TaxID=74318 RepID=A0A495D497_9PROT|nr:shikimate dehydrogenase [Maricaulis maris]RKQ96743.1 shikimate dehydrogenase [Maricaulis maris]